jgi:hypothetical protein
VANTEINLISLINTIQERKINIQSLDISNSTISENIFSILNPFIAQGTITSLSMNSVNGNPIMIEGICASLLLNNNLESIKLQLDGTATNSKQLLLIK